MTAPFVTYVVYDHPSDYPDNYVVRRFLGLHPEVTVELYTDLEKVERELHYRGLVKLMPMPEDDPTILQTWI